MANFERRKVQTMPVGESMTKQSDALDSDVNAIAHRWIAHGVPPRPPGQEPRYGDFSSMSSFHESVERVRQAELDFAELPAHIRDVCRNDPGRYLDLVLTPEGRRDLEAAGLKAHQVPPGAPEPAPAEEPTPAPAPAPTPAP